MRPYGIQDDHSENEEERMHSRSVSATATVKAVKAPSAKRVKCANAEQGDYGALGKANLVRLNATIKRMGDESRTMEEHLISATVHCKSISPTLLKQLASVKAECRPNWLRLNYTRKTIGAMTQHNSAKMGQHSSRKHARTLKCWRGC